MWTYCMQRISTLLATSYPTRYLLPLHYMRHRPSTPCTTFFKANLLIRPVVRRRRRALPTYRYRLWYILTSTMQW